MVNESILQVEMEELVYVPVLSTYVVKIVLRSVNTLSESLKSLRGTIL